MIKYVYQFTEDAGSKIFGMSKDIGNNNWVYKYHRQGKTSERVIDTNLIKSIIREDNSSLTPFRLEFIHD